ncbi:pitrilysin family protein [Elioraea sp.]|uniref:M16 family metallopeptidase n=1 Tax=Elioraea sp. TaxID=2185103 RepID=UPI0025C306CB|nr:pitrilysin family protein [Elioraea sp.]
MTDTIRTTRLPSGLTVVTETMPHVGTVSLGAYVAAGTRHERPEENGASHFLEHMAFKGTARRSAAKIAEEIEDVGGHLNAYTARERTAYYAKVLKEDAPLAADIIADILQHSVFDAEELERERGVILQEIGQANDTPDDIVFDHFQTTAYPDQPMGLPTLGTEDVIKAMPREALVSYMRQHYTPHRVVVAAAGAITHEAMLDLVAQHFTALPEGSADAPLPARYAGGEFREAQELDQVHLVLGFPSMAYDDPQYHAGLLLSTLLGGGMSSRLFQEVREKRGLVYAISSFLSPYVDGGTFGIYAGTGEKEVAELVPVVLGELAAVQQAVTEDELRRAKAQVKASLLMSLESTSSRCEQIAHHIHTWGRVIPMEESLAKLAAVTTDDVAAAARKMFRAAPTLAAVGPVAKLPGLPIIAGKLAA